MTTANRIAYADPGDTLDLGTVQTSCGEQTGHWYCVTHSEHLANNMQKEGHIYDGRHRLVWICHQHGPETP